MAQMPELEIAIYRQDAEMFTVELRFSRPDDATQRAPVRGPASFDRAELRALLLDHAAYGQLLTESLFADDAVRDMYDQVIAATQSTGQPLRLRLLIDRAAADLHDLHWELLRDPQNGSWLLTSENILFSRFLSSIDWRPVQLKPKRALRALAFIANPVDLAEGRYQIGDQPLAAVDVQAETARAEAGMGSMLTTVLASDPAQPGRGSLNALVRTLRDGYDVLYIVAHGALLRRDPPGPYLFLEGDDGTADIVPGVALVEALRDLPPRERPTLVVLASCQSAGLEGGPPRTADEQGALAALGPRLAEIGIPAVLAMQGSITMATVASFMPTFFEELRRHGQLDRAIAAARGEVRGAPDAWMPVLFMRLLGGQIWFESGFAGRQPAFEQWETLLSSIREGKCTPILGPGMYEFLLGSPREIAQRWARRAGIPANLARHDSMAQVAQFLATYQSAHYPHTQLVRYLEHELRQRYQDVLPENMDAAELEELLTELGALRRQDDPEDPFSVLAGLPIPIYVTANPDNLMAQALHAYPGKLPVEMCFVWRDYLRELPQLPLYDRTERFRPSVEEPLVYHLFGHLREPESMVLSEDDYFDYLMRVEDDAETDIPSFVDRALSENALLFLGFQIDDWTFRVLFRSIMTEQRRYRRRYHQSVAVQVDVSAGAAQPERIKRYLERYFGDRISIYYGSAEDFVRELGRQWKANAGSDDLLGDLL